MRMPSQRSTQPTQPNSPPMAIPLFGEWTLADKLADLLLNERQIQLINLSKQAAKKKSNSENWINISYKYEYIHCRHETLLFHKNFPKKIVIC